MGGLLVVFGAYLVGSPDLSGRVEVQKFRQSRLAADLAQVNAGYTNTLRLKAQAQVLQETVNLRYAALDCWMRRGVDAGGVWCWRSWLLQRPAILQIEGTAPVDQQERITEFWQSLRARWSAGRISSAKCSFARRSSAPRRASR